MNNITFIRSMVNKTLGKEIIMPVDIEGILTDKYSFDVLRIDLKGNICAVVDLDDRVIGLNKDHHIHRQRFTLAHELGHYLLCHKERKKEELVINLNDTDQYEWEANIFAGELLVPLQIAKKYKNNFDSNQLSNIFLVSSEVLFISFLRYRLI